MRVLIACEFSGIVREAFRKRGHDAWSCDLLDTELPGQHFQQNIERILAHGMSWDLLIAHPPCTRLSNSGVKHLYKRGKKDNGIDEEKWQQMRDAAMFFNFLKECEIPRKAIENPVMHKHAIELTGGRATQYVQPWWFGQKKNKATGFRLIGLPKLKKTNVVGPMPKTVLKGTPEYRSWNEVWYASPGLDRWKNRSRMYQGIADAMAEQWGW